MSVIDGHTLYMLRHAKSSWDEPLRDHERPLDARGVRDARAAGRLLAERGWRPDLVLCSPAVRTRETWQQAAGAGAEAGEVRFVDAIYEASVVRLLGLVQQTPEDVATLMLIGHGPGLPGLAEGLGGRPEPQDAWARMDAKYPTAGLAVLRLPGPWAAAAPGAADPTERCSTSSTMCWVVDCRAGCSTRSASAAASPTACSRAPRRTPTRVRGRSTPARCHGAGDRTDVDRRRARPPRCRRHHR